MIEEEAKLIFRCISKIKDKTILNIGSSDEQFYKKDQPYIWKTLMKPLIDNGNKIINLDKKDSKGVDIVGDAANGIKGTYDVILFCNCIEHLKTPFIDLIRKLYYALNEDGILIISAPGVYPIHVDPIDNEMRFPDLKRWVSLFEFCEERFRIIEYAQTEEQEAPMRYCFKEMTYASIVKCIKNKRFIPTMNSKKVIETDYLLLKLKELEIKNPKDKIILEVIKFIRLKLDNDGVLAVKLMLKDKVKSKNKDKRTLFYAHILGIIRQGGRIHKGEVI